MKTSRSKQQVVAGLVALGLINSACDKSNRSFSLTTQGESFQQGDTTFTQRKIDILWVVDNSGSMQTSQANLASNFSAFINKFQTLGIDYHMAVITSDAYLAGSYFNNSQSSYSATAAQFKDGSTGTYGQGHSGVFVMTPSNTTASIFQKNISMSTEGSGDERAFSSFVQALSDPWNTAAGFRRSDAFLSIIILSDEDDFSGNASNCDHFYTSCASNYVGDHNYNVSAPTLQPVSYYSNWLDSYAGGHSNYAVSVIYADSSSCLTTLNGQTSSTGRLVATRYPALANLTNGQKGSLCGNFATTLTNFAQSTLELASVFKLSIVPNVSTIIIKVNGVLIANDAVNGWTYDSATNSIYFHGNAIPPAGANISVSFTPATAQNN